MYQQVYFEDIVILREGFTVNFAFENVVLDGLWTGLFQVGTKVQSDVWLSGSGAGSVAVHFEYERLAIEWK